VLLEPVRSRGSDASPPLVKRQGIALRPYPYLGDEDQTNPPRYRNSGPSCLPFASSSRCGPPSLRERFSSWSVCRAIRELGAGLPFAIFFFGGVLRSRFTFFELDSSPDRGPRNSRAMVLFLLRFRVLPFRNRCRLFLSLTF